MPSKAKRPCLHPGCPELVPSGYCDKHKRDNRTYDKNRPNAYQRGYDRRWQRARGRYLIEHPLCVECMQIGSVTPATVVDHIIPHKGNYKLFWDENNWQALCKRCHDRKTAKEDGGFGNG